MTSGRPRPYDTCTVPSAFSMVSMSTQLGQLLQRARSARPAASACRSAPAVGDALVQRRDAGAASALMSSTVERTRAIGLLRRFGRGASAVSSNCVASAWPCAHDGAARGARRRRLGELAPGRRRTAPRRASIDAPDGAEAGFDQRQRIGDRRLRAARPGTSCEQAAIEEAIARRCAAPSTSTPPPAFRRWSAGGTAAKSTTRRCSRRC